MGDFRVMNRPPELDRVHRIMLAALAAAERSAAAAAAARPTAARPIHAAAAPPAAAAAAARPTAARPLHAVSPGLSPQEAARLDGLPPALLASITRALRRVELGPSAAEAARSGPESY
jgi:hypothetical protein